MPLVFATLKLCWISLSLDSSGNFLVNISVTFGKSKSNSEFASLIILFLLASLDLDSIFYMWSKFFAGSKTVKNGFSRSLDANFDSSLVDTRSEIATISKNKGVFAIFLITHRETYRFLLKFLKSQNRAF